MLREKVQHFSERKTYFFNCVDTSGGYDLQTAHDSLPSKLLTAYEVDFFGVFLYRSID